MIFISGKLINASCSCSIFFSNVYFKGKRFDQCPRFVLQKQCQQAKNMGYAMKSGIEREFAILYHGRGTLNNVLEVSQSHRVCHY